MKQRIFAVFLSLTLLVGLFPVTALADGFQAEQEILSNSSTDSDPVQGFSAEEDTSNGFSADPSQNLRSNELLTEDPESSISYQEYDEATGTFVPKSRSDAEELTSNTAAWGTDNTETWYVVSQNLSINNTITIRGDVHLILEDNYQLSTQRISFAANSTLTIYAQSTAEQTMGKLTVSHGTSPSTDTMIGSSESPAALTIHGGAVSVSPNGVPALTLYGSLTIYGGSFTGSNNCIGINIPSAGSMRILGGTVSSPGDSGQPGITNDGSITISGGSITTSGSYSGLTNNGSITVSGGSLTANGSNYGIINNGSLIISDDGTVSATGGGGGGITNSDSGTIEISGGALSAGGSGNACISNSGTFTVSGGSVTGSGKIFIRNNSTFTVSGGSITATSDNNNCITNNDPGTIEISGGSITLSGNRYYTGIMNYSSKTVEISGGSITIQDTDNGICNSNSGQLIISGGFVTISCDKQCISNVTSVSNAVITVNKDWNDLDSTPVSNSIIIQGNDGTVYNDYSLSQEWTLDQGKKLTIPEGASLTVEKNITFAVNGSLTIEEQGTMILQRGSTLTLGTLANNGEIILYQECNFPEGQMDNGTITSIPAATGISLSRSSLSLTPGGSSQLAASIQPEGASWSDVTWSTTDSTIAALNTTTGSAVTVTAGRTGTAAITVSTEDGTISASCTVTVSNPYYPVTGITLDQTSLSLEKGGNASLKATVTPSYASNPTVAWSSSDPSVATVSSSGTVTAVGGGTAVITARAGSYSAPCTVTVTVPATGLTLDQESLELSVGGQGTLTASLTPEDAAEQQILWSSSDPSVVTVEESAAAGAVVTETSETTSTDTAETANTETSESTGTDITVTGASTSTAAVTAVGKGTAVITAATADGAFSASCTVTVPGTPSATGLTVSGRTTSSVTLSWDAVEEAEGYTIWYRSEYESSVTRKIIWDGDSTTWTKTGLEPGTKYFFAIRSWVTDADGKYVFSEASLTQRGTTKPKAAQIQSVTVSNGYVKVRLTGEAEGAKRYSICYADSRNGFAENNFLVGIRTSYTVRTMTPQLEPGTYYICVKSYRDLGNSKRIYGDWSNIVRVTVR